LYRGNADGKAPQTNNLKRIIWASVVVLAIVALVTIGAFLVGRPDNSTDKPSVLSSPSKQPGPDISNTLPSVLTIVVVGKHDTNVVQGSGFILNATGLAGTNYHVLKGAVKAYAESADGHQFEIRSIEGIDKNRDLVVFQLVDRLTGETPTNLSSVSIRSSNGLTIGERVVAIGSPEGLQNTVSDGILSAIREIDGTRFLQITAPISPGSSGGPVLAMRTGRWLEWLLSSWKKGRISILRFRWITLGRWQINIWAFRFRVGTGLPAIVADSYCREFSTAQFLTIV
jgi:S1-C subfamily serine protease